MADGIKCLGLINIYNISRSLITQWQNRFIAVAHYLRNCSLSLKKTKLIRAGKIAANGMIVERIRNDHFHDNEHR